MRAYLIETQQVICANETCASHDSEESACFHRFGTTSSGSARVRCKTCGKTQSFSANPTWKQKVADKNALVLSLLVNKTAMRRILEIAEIGAQTLYRKLEHFERQCLLFAASMERRLPAMSFTHLDLATDRQDYLINWGSHINRRSFSLRAAATSDRQSGFVFGIHSNFDPALGAVEVEHAARACGDLMRDVYLREHARVWLLSDYARVAESNAAVAKRDGRVNTQRQPEQAGLISDPDPFAEDYEQTAPSRGVQVRQEYVLMAHFLFLNSMLVGARRVTLFLDPDSGIRTAAMLGFHERIRAGEVDAFLVRSEKELTVNKRDTSLSQSEHRLAQFMAERPGLSRWEAGIAWLEEAFEAVLPQGLNPTPWVPHPFSDRAEPGKQISLLTPRLDSNSNRVCPQSNFWRAQIHRSIFHADSTPDIPVGTPHPYASKRISHMPHLLTLQPDRRVSFAQHIPRHLQLPLGGRKRQSHAGDAPWVGAETLQFGRDTRDAASEQGYASGKRVAFSESRIDEFDSRLALFDVQSMQMQEVGRDTLTQSA
jgi:transposase-like protein